MAFPMRVESWIYLLLLATAFPAFAHDAPAKSSGKTSSDITVHALGRWKRVETPNFQCWCQLSDEYARQLAESCEVWRDRLRKTWMSDPDNEGWTPKCEVVVHPDRQAYNRALNRPGDTSVGSTQMNFDERRTVYRRVDVRADAPDWSNAALPHELTHVVLGERFGGRPLPRWADEGIAMLSESTQKHRERLENLREILAKRPTFGVEALLNARQFPEPRLRDAFYGQSLALASLLIRKSSPSRFADFVEDCAAMGSKDALQKHFGIHDVGALQHEWNQWTQQPEAVTFVSLSIQVDSDPVMTTAVAP